MKRYEFNLTIIEGNDEFWESIEDRSGWDEVEALIKEALTAYGFDDYNSSLLLVSYKNIEEG